MNKKNKKRKILILFILIRSVFAFGQEGQTDWNKLYFPGSPRDAHFAWEDSTVIVVGTKKNDGFFLKVNPENGNILDSLTIPGKRFEQILTTWKNSSTDSTYLVLESQYPFPDDSLTFVFLNFETFKFGFETEKKVALDLGANPSHRI